MGTIMDLAALSGSFATIVGLLTSFKAERSSNDLPSFFEWLREHHQEGLADSISANQALSTQLTGLLTTNHEELVARLDDMNNQIAVVAQTVEGFGSIAKVLSPASSLSPQAHSLLKQIASSKAKYVMEHKQGSDSEFLFIDGALGKLEAEESQFVGDDLASLETQGLLRMEIASKGNSKFFVTRLGLQLAESRDEKCITKLKSQQTLAFLKAWLLLLSLPLGKFIRRVHTQSLFQLGNVVH